MCGAARVQWISRKALLQQACRAADLSMCPKPNKSRRFQACCPFPTQHTQLAQPGIPDDPLLCLSYCTNVKKKSPHSDWREFLGGKKIKMSWKARHCWHCHLGVWGLGRPGLSVWQTSSTWLFGPAADLVSYCVCWLSSKIQSSLDISSCRFPVGCNC